MDIDILRQELKNNNIDSAIRIIKEFGENKFYESVPYLIKCFEDTNNHRLRNTIAIALADIGDKSALKPIINALNDPKTIGKRGTLLYALGFFDYSPYIELLINFIISGNFEESRQSLSLIESIDINIEHEIIDECTKEIDKDINKLEEKIEFLLEALDILESLKK
ncbi:MAG: HEAT repeat domain-containing protein [Clostridium lundense]|nr:HEAT repeat domain-containing protein [Clostridium lundense]